MAYKIFLDTHIILDFLLERKYDLDAINELFTLAEKGLTDMYISENVVTTTFSILRKEKRIDTLSAFREMCKIVNTITFSKEVLYYSLENFKDKEDGILHFSALKAKMNYFITGNVKDFTFLFPSLPVLSPSNFLKEIYFNDLP